MESVCKTLVKTKFLKTYSWKLYDWSNHFHGKSLLLRYWNNYSSNHKLSLRSTNRYIKHFTQPCAFIVCILLCIVYIAMCILALNTVWYGILAGLFHSSMWIALAIKHTYAARLGIRQKRIQIYFDYFVSRQHNHAILERHMYFIKKKKNYE